MQINHHVGRLVRDVNFTVRGEKETKIAYFKLAMNDLKDGKATYIDYVAFNKTAELILDYVTDIGQVVEVEFVMRNHNYTDKKKVKKFMPCKTKSRNSVSTNLILHLKIKVNNILRLIMIYRHTRTLVATHLST
ncbi:single-stranded DNA-binding protein [Leuconostoc mesenteroides]|uniref:single-stranded DNA-binding protein n=1 Tax=Leuconostoc mesenteroides TaxID=1245 RepID=UPI0021A4AFF6|nr:single-stranded DNA-binding protein [Leuconostoc mesenteroides]